MFLLVQEQRSFTNRPCLKRPQVHWINAPLVRAWELLRIICVSTSPHKLHKPSRVLNEKQYQNHKRLRTPPGSRCNSTSTPPRKKWGNVRWCSFRMGANFYICYRRPFSLYNCQVLMHVHALKAKLYANVILYCWLRKMKTKRAKAEDQEWLSVFVSSTWKKSPLTVNSRYGTEGQGIQHT